MNPLGPREPLRAVDKSPDAFRTISEVAEDLDLPQHVLRFWETRFAQIKPLKRGGGRRYYRPDDIDLLKGIRHLLYGEGYTIKGVQRILKEDGVRFVQAIGRGEQSVASPPASDREAGRAALDEMEALDPHALDGRQDGQSGQAYGTSPAERAAGNLPASAGALSGDDLARLRTALDELLECDRVLAALKSRNEADEPAMG